MGQGSSMPFSVLRLYFIISTGNITVNGSFLALPDFMATNGVVHYATKVLLPRDWDFS